MNSSLHTAVAEQPAPAFNRPKRNKAISWVPANGRSDCGPACLSMIFKHYRLRASLIEIAEKSDVGRDGTNAKALLEIGRQYGFEAKGFSADPSALSEICLPAILHWERRHFVVLERIDAQGFHIVDPQAGSRRLSPAEFSESFSGVVLTLMPGENFKAEQSVSSDWLVLMRKLLNIRSIKPLLVQTVLICLAIQAIGLVTPLTTKVVVDQMIPAGSYGLMNLLLLGIVITAFAYGVGQYLRSSILLILQQRLNTRMMISFCRHLFSLPLAFFQRRTTGDLLLRMNSNSVIKELLSSQFSSLFLDSIFVLAYFVAIFFLSWQYGLIVALFAVVQIGLILATARPIHRFTQQELVTQSAYQSQLVELLRGIETVKATGAEERILHRWTDLFFDNLSVAIRSGHLTALVDVLMRTLSVTAPLVLLWFGATQVLAGNMTLGTMFALQTLAASTLAPLTSLVANAQRLQMVGAHIERITGVFDAKPERDQQSLRKVDPGSGISVDQVSFRFPGAPMDTLQDVSLSISAGEKIAIVGPSGSGKSTLTKLLFGLLLPDRGCVRFDGHLLSEIDLKHLRNQAGLVLQSPHLFSGSIADNIAFGHDNVSRDAVIQAAAVAAIHDDIRQMPLGYETPLAESGAGLSGGQKQRIAIARALAGSPRLLMLDEATSHLDSQTEKAVFAGIAELSCTSIIVAHRLTTIVNADRILVVDRGRIVQQGTHRQLMHEGGLYRNLYDSQQQVADQ